MTYIYVQVQKCKQVHNGDKPLCLWLGRVASSFSGITSRSNSMTKSMLSASKLQVGQALVRKLLKGDNAREDAMYNLM